MKKRNKGPSSFQLWLGAIIAILKIILLIFISLIFYRLLTDAEQMNAIINELINQAVVNTDFQLKGVAEGLSTMTQNNILLTKVSLIIIGTSLLLAFFSFAHSIWLPLKFQAIRQDIKVLQERYSLLLGSKKIVDSELLAAKSKIAELENRLAT